MLILFVNHHWTKAHKQSLIMSKLLTMTELEHGLHSSPSSRRGNTHTHIQYTRKLTFPVIQHYIHLHFCKERQATWRENNKMGFGNKIREQKWTVQRLMLLNKANLCPHGCLVFANINLERQLSVNTLPHSNMACCLLNSKWICYYK